MKCMLVVRVDIDNPDQFAIYMKHVVQTAMTWAQLSGAVHPAKASLSSLYAVFYSIEEQSLQFSDRVQFKQFVTEALELYCQERDKQDGRTSQG